MARSEKKGTPPSLQIAAPGALSPIMQAFHVESKEVAHALILEASKAIYGSKKPEYDFMGPGDREITEGELEGITLLIKGLTPKDSLEALYVTYILSTGQFPNLPSDIFWR